MTTRHLKRDQWQTTVGVLIIALLVVAVCWFFGANLWHAVLLAVAVTTLGVVVLVGAPVELADIRWRGHERFRQDGSRGDVSALSGSLRGSYGRVGQTAMWRVVRLGRERLARHHLDLNDPADHAKIEQLIGRRAYAVLVRGNRRPPPLRSLLACLDALDALDPTPTKEKP